MVTKALKHFIYKRVIIPWGVKLPQCLQKFFPGQTILVFILIES